MNILKELKWNHQEIRSTLRHVSESQSSRTWERRVLTLAGSLAAHFAFERKTIFKRLDDLIADSRHAETESRKQTALLNELYALLDTASDENFPDTLAAFGIIEQDIEDHLSYQEQNIFPLFRITVSFRDTGRSGAETAIAAAEHFNRLV